MELNLSTITQTGLNSYEVNTRFKSDGYNELPSQKKQNILTILIKVLSEPMLLLLLMSGIIYLLLGEIKDALMLLSCIFVVIGITFYQERKTERVLETLKNLSSPRATVIRDGERKIIAGREIVVGDIIILHEGDRVPADAKVLQCENLLIDESLLTGESVSVRKSVWNLADNIIKLGGDDTPFIFSGSLIVGGKGIAQVTSIGIRTEIGKIGKALEIIKDEDTLLKKETAKFVTIFSIIGVLLCAIVILIYGLARGNFLEGFLYGLALSMSMLPEEFPVVLIIFLTLGAWRISKNKVLTRRSAVIETLGAATVLCVDKTGTLTMNRMQLTNLYTKDTHHSLNSSENRVPNDYFQLLEYALLACQKDPYDPIEKEIKRVSENYITNELLHNDWIIVKEYPLTKELLAYTYVWKKPEKQEFIIATKGAPEAILDLCHVDAIFREKIIKEVKIMSEQGLRILGVAKSTFFDSKLPESQKNYNYEFVGLLGFIDPIRESVPAAVKDAQNAGIRIIMITGDYQGTASYVAKNIGIAHPDSYMLGSELTQLSQREIQDKIKNINIFARVIPEQKLILVNAFKANGEIVAMTGDGVNDAPALKSAHIGIAMGERGTDVAREAAALVLLNDDFSSIVIAVRLGRRIYNNIKRAMGYIFAVHIPIAGISFIPVIFNLPPVLLPSHIAFLELIIDPACSIIFESQKEGDRIMQKPPRSLFKPMFDKKTILMSVFQGMTVLLSVTFIYLYYLFINNDAIGARTVGFTTLVLSNLLLIATNLSWHKNIFQIIFTANKSFYIISAFAILALIIDIYVPFFTDMFHFRYLQITDIALSVTAASLGIVWFEIYKRIH